MRIRRQLTVTLALLLATIAVAGACSSGSADLYDTIKSKGKIVVVTDPAYPPQSEQLPDGSLQGFDVDVANEVAKRLGVTTEFSPTTNFDLVVAGGWAGRWDMSAGSVTITEERKAKLDFTPPYYFTPAQMGVVTDSGITTLDGLAAMPRQHQQEISLVVVEQAPLHEVEGQGPQTPLFGHQR